MTGLSKVVLHPDETLPSFLSRLARANGRETLQGFLRDFDLSPIKIQHGNIAEIERLARITDTPLDELLDRSIRVHGRSVEYRGEEFHYFKLSRSMLRVCAHCLRDDERRSVGKPGTRSYARALWMISIVYSCPRHDRALTAVDARTEGMPDLYRGMEKSADALARAVLSDEVLLSTGFERFVERRLAAIRSDGEFLDKVSLQTAIDLCEIFGMARLRGRRFRVRGSDEQEYREATELGYRALASGRDGVLAILERLASEKSRSAIRGGYGIYGNLYFLLNHKTRGREYDAIRQIVREHTTGAVATLPGARVFGKVGEAGSAVIYSLAKETGLHWATVARYLADIAGNELVRQGHENTFIDTTSANDALAALSDTVLLPAASEILGWKINDCRRLVGLGILVPAIGRAVKGFGLKPRYARSAVLELKERLLAKATAHSGDLQTLRRLNLSIVEGQDDVLRAVFEGRLQSIGYVQCRSVLDAISVDLREVIRGCPGATISGSTVCKMLRLESTTLLGLLSIGAFENRAQGAAIAIRTKDLDAFDRKYVSAAQVKRDHGLRRGDFDRRLSESGVKLAFPFEDIGQMILERADVPRLLLAKGR